MFIVKQVLKKPLNFKFSHIMHGCYITSTKLISYKFLISKGYLN